MSEYTPTTEQMRSAWIANRWESIGQLRSEGSDAEVDRWLLAHDAEIRTATLKEAAVKLLASPIGIQITNGIGWSPTNSLAGAARYLQHLGHHAGTE
jgi:hypothetical protein